MHRSRAAVLNEGYDGLAINTASRWRGFIDRLHGLQSARGKAPVIRDLQLVDWKAAGRSSRRCR
jgi:hypothetical protein